MALNQVKVGCAFTFMKCLATVVSLIFLSKTLIWNKIMFPASNSLNFAELVGNENLKKEKENKILPIFLFLSNLSLLIRNILRAHN